MSIVNYEDKNGKFYYDDEMFELKGGRLQLKISYKGPIDFPRGCTSCQGAGLRG